MKKKGFTLIELLAVIVVLAIIALIATPIVMNLIKNAGKGAAERSGERYLKAVETMIATERAKDGTIVEDGTYTIGDGKISKDGKEYTIEVTGDYPKEGSIVISNGQVVSSGTSMVIGDYTVTVDTQGKATASEAPEAAKLCTLEEGTALAVGSKYTCDLGDGDRYFYVLENKADSDDVSLILEENYDTTTHAWCDQLGENWRNNECDADGLTLKLEEIRDAWEELDRDQVTLPSAVQIVTADGQEEDAYLNSPSLSNEWLYSNNYWYWTSTPNSNDPTSAWCVRSDGQLAHGCDVDSASSVVRPVIVVAKSDI